MKKYACLILLCLLLTGCGVFEVNVRMLPSLTEPAHPGATVSPVLALSPTVQPSETPPAIATSVVAAEPTSIVLQAGQPITLTALQMGDGSEGWAVESSGHIVKTSDGGLSWKNAALQGSFDIHSLFAFNKETVWAVPTQLDVSNVVWRTQDGGETWEASQPIQLGSGRYSPLEIQFPDARNGWLLVLAHDDTQGSYVLLYKSSDGGQNWEQVSSLLDGVAQSYLPDAHTTAAFFDGQTGWVGGWWGKDDPSQWMALKTVDGGATWKTEALPLPGQSSLTCDGHPVIEMGPGDMAVDMSCTQASDPKFRYHHLFYLSATGSPVWRSWKLSGEFQGIDFVNANQGWMLVAPGGPLNEIYRTTDGGKTWTNINVVAWKHAQFNFVNGGVGWAIVSDGSAVALVQTVNGGQTWAEIKPVVANP
jgi:photosystem II stability/assembly factor-like uncharacterized protein